MIVDATNSSFGFNATVKTWETAGIVYWTLGAAEPVGPEPY